MAKFTKWIAGGLGWAFLGPIGGLMGFFIGSMFDQQDNIPKNSSNRTTTGDFMLSLMVLIAAVMKADGKVMKSELEYVKAYFVRKFGQPTASEAIKMLRDLLKQNIPVKDVSKQIASRLDYSSRLELIHLLFGIIVADGMAKDVEIKMVEYIASHLSVAGKDVESIKSMFIEQLDASYKILEVDKNASNEEIRNAYKKMALKYHPDKVSYLGSDVRKQAEDKFKKVNMAYEKIKKERGLN